jgi:hypothetical protein
VSSGEGLSLSARICEEGEAELLNDEAAGDVVWKRVGSRGRERSSLGLTPVLRVFAIRAVVLRPQVAIAAG